MELREYGDLIFSPGATSGAETAKVVMLANGNMTVAGAISASSATIPTLSGATSGNFTGSFSGNVSFGSGGVLTGDQGGSLELGNSLQAGAAPFIDFHYGTGAAQDFNVRLINDANGRLTMSGSLNVSGAISAPSATIPTLNGNVTVGGEITANVVTVLGGSDVAEPYEVASAGEIKPVPGMVVAIDSKHVGQMRVAARAYDKTVAGILSGANGIAPGITLRQKGTVADGTHPVASIGRVWCWCDADANGPIEAGDMLTTSDTPGHAMRVVDHNEANGAVIGKAMSGLESGKGLVLVLVSLK